MTASSPLSPVWWRRLLCALYELLLLFGVWFTAAAIHAAVVRHAPPNLTRASLQLWLLAVTFAYFGWSWTHGGQTLPMKTWWIRLESIDGRTLSWRQAGERFLWLLLLAPVSWLGIFSKQQQTWHDQRAKTRLVHVSKPNVIQPPPR